MGLPDSLKSWIAQRTSWALAHPAHEPSPLIIRALTLSSSAAYRIASVTVYRSAVGERSSKDRRSGKSASTNSGMPPLRCNRRTVEDGTLGRLPEPIAHTTKPRSGTRSSRKTMPTKTPRKKLRTETLQRSLYGGRSKTLDAPARSCAMAVASLRPSRRPATANRPDQADRPD